MRLTEHQRSVLKKNFQDIFGDGKIYLFGSRIDDSKKGGDIDLYISTNKRDSLVEKKIDFLANVKREIGEQKIDVVFDKGQNRPIDKKAKVEGIML